MMKQQCFLFVPLIALACLMSACATSDGEAIPASIVRYPQTSPSAVKVLFESPSQKHKVIGRVEAVAEFASEEKLHGELKKQAGSLGGDAVIVERGRGKSFGGLRWKTTGTVIRFE